MCHRGERLLFPARDRKTPGGPIVSFSGAAAGATPAARYRPSTSVARPPGHVRRPESIVCDLDFLPRPKAADSLPHDRGFLFHRRPPPTSTAGRSHTIYAGEHGPQLRPRRIRDRPRQCPVAAHVPHAQILDGDHLVLAHQPSRELVQMIATAIGDPRVNPCHLHPGLGPVRRVLLFPRQYPLGLRRPGAVALLAPRIRNPGRVRIIRRRERPGRRLAGPAPRRRWERPPSACPRPRPLGRSGWV